MRVTDVFPSGRWCVLVLVLLLRIGGASGQALTFQIVKEMSCINDTGDINVDFIVKHTLSNEGAAPLRIAISNDQRDMYDLFKADDSTTAAKPVYGYYPDYVGVVGVTERLVGSHGSTTWTKKLSVMVSGHAGGYIGLPEPGKYIARLASDVSVVSPKHLKVRIPQAVLSLTIDAPTSEPSKCSASRS